MGITALVTLIINVVLTLLQAENITSPAITSLVNGLEGAVLPLLTNINSGTTVTSDVLAALGALSGVLGVLKLNTTLDPAVLAQVNALDASVQAALVAYVQGGKGIDLTVLTPIPPVV